jgi:SAM-dependent methyltransferase
MERWRRPSCSVTETPPRRPDDVDGGASYHLEELKIALSTDDRRRIMPPIPPGCRRIVDVGCGMGQTLIASNTRGAVACGVEPDLDAVRLGRRLSPHLPLVCGAAERLPIRTGWAEFAIARLSLPYTDIPVAVREVYRALEPGGVFWTVLHPVGMTLRKLLDDAGHLRLRGVAFQAYVLLNGVALHTTGQQFRFPLNRARCESFQTAGGMRRLLASAGYESINITFTPFLVITARKPGATTPLAETG